MNVHRWFTAQHIKKQRQSEWGDSPQNSIPPLRFAEDLRRQDHPLAPEVIDLTGIYLDVRFGGTDLTQTLARSFDRVLVGHGAPLTMDGRTALSLAYSWLRA